MRKQQKRKMLIEKYAIETVVVRKQTSRVSSGRFLLNIVRLPMNHVIRPILSVCAVATLQFYSPKNSKPFKNLCSKTYDVQSS